MKSVEKNQVSGCSLETPTVCPSPHDEDVHFDDGDGEEPVLPAPIGDHAPSVERVLNEVQGSFVTKVVSRQSWQSLRMSPYQLGWYRRRNARMVCDTLMASASNSLLQ